MTALHRLAAAPGHKPFARLLAGALLACLLCALPGRALAVSDDPVLRRMDTVLEENARLRDEAWKARKNGHEAAKQAEEALNASDERVEKTRTEALAHVAGVSQAQVESLRRDGRSWGQAAGELGVHPGFLGIGKTPLYEPHYGKAPADPADGGKVKSKRSKKGRKVQAAPEKVKGKKRADKEARKPDKVTSAKAKKPAPAEGDKPARKSKKRKKAKE